MKTVHKNLAKALVGTVAAGAMAVSAAAPAQARGGIDAGEVIAGALVIGGIAAIASAASDNDSYAYQRAGYDGRYDTNRYGYNGRGWGRTNPRQAVSQCVAAAERTANRRSWGGRADVTDIRSVRTTRYGAEVRGRIAVNQMGRGWRSGDGYYGRGWGGDYRGWNNNLRGYDAGSFRCIVQNGRVVGLDIDGIRGL